MTDNHPAIAPKPILRKPFTALASDQNQTPLFQAPASSSKNQDQELLLSDVLTLDPQIKIFTTMLHDTEIVDDLLGKKGFQGLILAPSNDIMNALPKKPWEGNQIISESADDQEVNITAEQADKNTETFIKNHIVPQWPWSEGQKIATLSTTNKQIWWEEDEKEQCRRIMPFGIKVVEVAQLADNGEIWVIDGVLG